jgi:hypothetical protein
VTENHQLKLNLQTAEDQVKQLKTNISSDSNALQQQVQEVMTKLQTKKQKARVLKDHKARLIKEAEDAAVQKKFELEQLQQSFKYQISLLENEIGQYKNDIVKLE